MSTHESDTLGTIKLIFILIIGGIFITFIFSLGSAIIEGFNNHERSFDEIQAEINSFNIK